MLDPLFFVFADHENIVHRAIYKEFECILKAHNFDILGLGISNQIFNIAYHEQIFYIVCATLIAVERLIKIIVYATVSTNLSPDCFSYLARSDDYMDIM